jgi:transposase-like protein
LKKVYPKVTSIAKPPTHEDFSRTLDELARAKVGELIQAVLIAEVDEFIHRLRTATNATVTGAHRDGYEDERTVTYGSLPVKIRRPRVRGVEAPFVSEVLPPHRRRFADVDKTLHELWIQGLSTRDFEPSLRALLGKTTPLSPSTISRVNKQFRDEYEAWCKRDISNDFVYLWADGIYLGAGPQDDRRVMLTVIGVDTNGDKALLAMEDAMSESAESWSTVFTCLQKRGLRDIAMLVADGAGGVWSALEKTYPDAKQQRCWLHKMRNVLDKVPERLHDTTQEALRAMMNAKNRRDAEAQMEQTAESLKRDYPKAANCLRDDAERMLAYYAFPEPHWRHLRTTNIIESNFDVVRTRTNVCKRLRVGESATYLVYALLIRRSSRWRKFNGYKSLITVHQKISAPVLEIKRAA